MEATREGVLMDTLATTHHYSNTTSAVELLQSCSVSGRGREREREGERERERERR